MSIQRTGGKKKTWRLGPNEQDELVICMQGIISKLELQPGNVTKFGSNSAVNLTQSIEIVGLGGPNFQRCVEVSHSIHQFYAQNFVGVNMSRWDVDDNTYGVKLKLATRFFTSTLEEPKAVAVPLQPGTDLLGVLQKFEGSHLVHTSENVVRYYRKAVDPKTQDNVYDVTFPGTFKIGDIVEVHGSLVAFTTKKGKEMRMHFGLHSVTLLDASFSKAATAERNKEHQDGSVQTTNMRRKAPYAQDDNIAVAQKKFKSLVVTDTNK
ncbi:hypothetical protein C8J57DRAFT_1508245 [Mycena rebaudengoi]|nr:hypothetical protein C8J57DRAFT_1508245 [Mycena rebaudengoi]